MLRVPQTHLLRGDSTTFMYMTECYNYSPDSHWDAICQKCPVCKINQPCNSFPLCIRVPEKLMSNLQTIWKKYPHCTLILLYNPRQKNDARIIYIIHMIWMPWRNYQWLMIKCPYAPRGHCPQNAHKAWPKSTFWGMFLSCFGCRAVSFHPFPGQWPGWFF